MAKSEPDEHEDGELKLRASDRAYLKRVYLAIELRQGHQAVYARRGLQLGVVGTVVHGAALLANGATREVATREALRAWTRTWGVLLDVEPETLRALGRPRALQPRWPLPPTELGDAIEAWGSRKKWPAIRALIEKAELGKGPAMLERVRVEWTSRLGVK
jgi:hypothetical protein